MPPIPFKGLDLQSGKRGVDLWSGAFKSPKSSTTGQTEYKSPYVGAAQQSPTPVDSSIESYGKWLEAFAPYDEKRAIRATQLTAALNRQTLSDLYPFMSAAGAEATARNLAASQAYRRFAEGLPSNVQNIAASKQGQIQSAQAGEADLMRAVASQQQAAKDFAGRYAGQYVSYS